MGDRSIIRRLDFSADVFKVQYLHRDTALFAECEWVWKDDRDGAHVFDTYAEAEAFAPKCDGATRDGARQHFFPHAIVLGAPEPDCAPIRVRDGAGVNGSDGKQRKHVPTPREVFEDLERRHLA